MRSLIISLLFFFGPVILMFVLRHAVLLLRLWLMMRRHRQSQPEVIDITPEKPQPPSVLFIVITLIAGSLFAYLAWDRITSEAELTIEKSYAPAHVDERGKIVPGHYE
jgi:hypothetical protein